MTNPIKTNNAVSAVNFSIHYYGPNDRRNFYALSLLKGKGMDAKSICLAVTDNDTSHYAHELQAEALRKKSQLVAEFFGVELTIKRYDEERKQNETVKN